MTAIPKTMKALVAHSKDDYRIQTLPVPIPGPGETLVKVEACGICAGDVKARHGAARFWGGDGMPGYAIPPFTPGHEFLGEIVALGEGAPLSIGDRIVSEQIVPCGHCRFCKEGKYSLCQPHDVYGFKQYLNGGMAEYVLLPRTARNFVVPKGLPLRKAILIEPFACSKHCVDRSQATYDDIVVLAGAGTLGLGMVGAMRKKNPKKLIVLDTRAERLVMAKAFGADLVMNPLEDDVTAAVMEMTDGYGCDIYIEATGNPAAVQQGLDLLRKQGRFVEFSVFSGMSTVDWSLIGDAKELDILGSHLSPECFPPVIEWIAEGSIPTEGVVSHVFALEDWHEAFEVAESGADAIKVVIKP